MTKALAGLLPVLILALCGASLARMLQVCAIAGAIAAPWHFWQLYAHPRWFWAEYILGEHFTWGTSAPQQTTQESHLVFYAKRLVMLDPVLLVAGGIAMFRLRSRLLFTWIGVVLLSALTWRYRNAAYLAPLAPALAIAVAVVLKQYRRPALGIAATIFVVKFFWPAAVFGLPLRPEVVNPSLAALHEYASKHRGRDLFLVEPDDQFYSAVLELPRVRYVWLAPATSRPKLPLDFEYLGITVSAADFARLNELLPTYAQRLREYNLDSTAPVATAILARTPQEISDLIASQPQADFFVPMDLGSPRHDRWQPAGSRVFLLSRQAVAGSAGE